VIALLFFISPDIMIFEKTYFLS